MIFNVAQIWQEGGPWVAFLLLLGLVVWMRLSGRWVTEKELDRTVSGHVETNKHLSTELAYFRQAGKDKDDTIRTLSEQNNKLMTHSAVSAYALKAITDPLTLPAGAPDGEARP